MLPYRAGYEDADRQAIQAALGNGGLAGVVATSALEFGLDICAIDTVVLLGVPPSNKAFWQRLGRDGRPPLSEAAADTIRRAFCIRSGAHGRELGVDRFSADHGPGGRPACKGICIFDAVSGSLRLTERLIDTFPEVLAAAVDLADEEDAPELAAELTELRDFAAALEPERVDDSGRVEPLADGDWLVVVAPGEPAVYFNGNGPEEVRIEGHRYSPQGLLYDLTPSLPGTRWTVTADRIQPMAGRTRLQRVNLVSGETAPLD